MTIGVRNRGTFRHDMTGLRNLCFISRCAATKTPILTALLTTSLSETSANRHRGQTRCKGHPRPFSRGEAATTATTAIGPTSATNLRTGTSRHKSHDKRSSKRKLSTRRHSRFKTGSGPWLGSPTISRHQHFRGQHRQGAQGATVVPHRRFNPFKSPHRFKTMPIEGVAVGP